MDRFRLSRACSAAPKAFRRRHQTRCPYPANRCDGPPRQTPQHSLSVSMPAARPPSRDPPWPCVPDRAAVSARCRCICRCRAAAPFVRHAPSRRMLRQIFRPKPRHSPRAPSTADMFHPVSNALHTPSAFPPHSISTSSGW